MRVMAALALAGMAVAVLPGCRGVGGNPAASPTPPQPQVALPTPAECTLDAGALPAVEESSLGLLNRLRDDGDPALRSTAALLAGSLSNTASDWERAYAFCALVPTTATTNQRVEAAVCQNKAAVSMGPARTACADVLASQWVADPARVGLGFAETAESEAPEDTAAEADGAD